MSNWVKTEQGLTSSSNFNDSKSLENFCLKLNKIADEQNHHPDLVRINERELKITLITHDTNSITEKDYVLAKSIDELIMISF